MARLYLSTILEAMQHGSAEEIADIIAGTSDDPDRLVSLGLLFAVARKKLLPKRLEAILQAVATHPRLAGIAGYLGDERAGDPNASPTGVYFSVHKTIYQKALGLTPKNIYREIIKKARYPEA